MVKSNARFRERPSFAVSNESSDH